MKKFGRVLSLVMVLTLVLSISLLGTAMADTEVDTTGTQTFALNGSYPEDGATETSVENMGVKLYFNKPMTSEVIGEANAKNFELVDPDGNKLPLKVLYAPKEDGVVLVLLDTENMPEDIEIQSPGEYTLKVLSTVVDDDGDTLGKDISISFTTQNQKRNGLINTLLMFVMMGGMMVFTMKGQKKNSEKEKEQKSKGGSPVNPYKEAKKTGKSVEEIVQKDQQKKDKQAAKEAKEAEKEAKLYEEYGLNEYAAEEYIEEGHYKVGKPRTVASAGSTYISGRKAKYEAMMERKAKEEKWAQEAKKKGKGIKKR